MKRIGQGLLAALLLLLAVIGVRTAIFSARRPEPAAVTARPLDADAAARRLAGGLRFRTVSHEDPAANDAAQFAAFRDYLARTFPRAHAALAPEFVGSASLLYTWRGRNPELPALLLLAHQDVVPVEAGTEAPAAVSGEPARSPGSAPGAAPWSCRGHAARPSCCTRLAHPGWPG